MSQEHRLNLSPHHTWARAIAQDEVHHIRINRVANPYILQGRGVKDALPYFSRMQWIVHRKVALEFEYEYPYVFPAVMGKVEANRESWYSDEVWEFFSILKPYRHS